MIDHSAKRKGFIFLLTLFIPFILGSSNQLSSDEYEYFYLYNNTTFSPGSDASINIYSYSKRSSTFKFRLIKIEDPEKFFTSVDRSTARYAFDIWGQNKEILLKHTRLIKEWNGKIKSNDHSYQSINVGKLEEPGIYILQALRGDLTAYCGIVVSDLSLVYKNTGKELVAFVANSRTGEFIKEVNLKVYDDNKLYVSKNSDSDGLIFIKLKDTESSQPLLLAKTNDEIVLSDPYFYMRTGNENNSSGYIYTNQPVYRPGQEIFFKAVVRDKKGNEFINLVESEFNVTIKSPKNKEVYTGRHKTNQFGSINGSFTLDDEADIGDYFITIVSQSSNFQASFSVEEYKKPEYLVKVTTDGNNFSSGDEISGKVTADYYFGSPVMNASVKLNIFRKYFWRPWWYWSEYAWFYKNYNAYYGGGDQLVKQIDGVFDENGEFVFSFKSDDEKDQDFVYTMTAEVTDLSRRAITGSAEAYITRGSFSVFTSPEKYFYEPGQKISIRVNAADFNDVPVETDFEFVVNFPYIKNKNNYDEVYRKIKGRTDKYGKALISFYSDSKIEGHFKYKITVVDDKDRQITAHNSFYAGNLYNYYHTRTSTGLEIVTNKDSYDKGDSLKAFVFLPFSNTELLMSFESGHIIKYKKIYSIDNSFEINEKLDDKFVPGFNLSVTFLKDKQFYNTSKLIGVLAKDKLLNVEIIPSKPEYKPGETAFYNISVKDQFGNPVKNTELSFGIIDESIYAIKEDTTPDIQNYFYAPVYSPVTTNSSNQYNYYSSSSRKATFIDKNFFDLANNDTRYYDGRLTGRVKLINSDQPASGIIILLSNNERFYSARTDSAGKYIFDKIAEESYEIFVFSGTTGFISLGKVKVRGKSIHNFEVDPNLIQRNEGDEITLGEVAFNLAPPSSRDGVREMSKSLGDKKEREKDDYVGAEVRSNFVDALIWLPEVITDNDGKAIVEFKIPDNLTTWRTTVRGVTKNTAVGQKTDKFISRKDLLIRMEVPRFFRKNDKLTISTIVHNYLNDTKLVKISFNNENVLLLGSQINSGKQTSLFNTNTKFYEIEIDKNSELRIDWEIEITEPIGDAVLMAEALTNEESDAVKLTVPILPAGIKQMKPLVFDFNDEHKDEVFDFNIPQNVDIRTAKFSFNVSPSLAGTLLKSLDDLAGYPYGCVEQTMSRFLPTLIVANTLKELNAPVKSGLINELPKMVEAGLKRLYNFQHADGGWGWWTNDQTHPYMTAYVVYGLSLARKAGFNIREGVLEKGTSNLKLQIESFGQNDETTLTYMLFALSASLQGNTDMSSHQKELISILARKKLNAYALSLLIQTARMSDDKQLAEDLSVRLISMVEEEKNSASWGGKQWHYNWQEDKVQSTAFAVKALLQTYPGNQLISKAVRWLLQQKNGFSWRSTQETATVIFALTDYLKLTDELNPDFDITVYVNDKKINSASFTKDDIYSASKTIKLNWNENVLRKGKNKVRVVKSGKGTVYFSSMNEYYSTDIKAAAKTSAFKIRRDYYILNPVQDGDRIVYEKIRFDGYVKSGQDILVKTFVTGPAEEHDYFILEDMLPSGFEIVKKSDEYFIKDENDYRYDYYYRDYRSWRWQYADREYRDEKVSFFVTKTRKEMDFSYIIKAQIPGRYSVASSQGYLMYYPEMNGVSELSELIILDIDE